jgi:hypothetical protein
VVESIRDPQPDDLLVIWNRGLRVGAEATRFERSGAKILVVENGLLGKGWNGGNWFSLAMSHVAVGGGTIKDGGPSRWNAIGQDLEPWREGKETVILEQRGIGEPGIKSPDQWAQRVQRQTNGRIRKHPGREINPKPIAEDLVDARCVVTWCSSAGLVALMAGVPVFYEHRGWIGAPAARHLSEWNLGTRKDDARLGMFQKAAWAMWRLEEIDNGTAFAHIL